MVRCIDGLAEIALAAGDASRCRAYADELLAIAEANGLRELEARRAALARRGFACAESLRGGAGGVVPRRGCWQRISAACGCQMDAEAALARLLRAQGQGGAAQRRRKGAYDCAGSREEAWCPRGSKARLRA